jgi:hypothetical protein
MTQTVTFQYRDKTGSYEVSAAVKRDTVFLLAIEDEYGTECEFSDWTDAEQYIMKGLAKKAVSELEWEDTNTPVDDWEKDEEVGYEG